MRVLADENVVHEWLEALQTAGHDVRRVGSEGFLFPGAPDHRVLEVATATDRVLLTADRSDFADPPFEDHSGIIVITDRTASGGAVGRGLSRIEETLPQLDGTVLFLGDWL